MNWDRYEPILRLLDDEPYHRTRRFRLTWGTVALILLTAAVYLRPALLNGLFWLDTSTLNRATSLFSLKLLWLQAPGAYRPLAMSLLWLEHRGFGSMAIPYHVIGLLVHAISSVLLWLILRRLGIRGAWLAGALFAVHPVQVQPVAWISQQPLLIGTLFYLLAILAFLRWLQIRPTGGAAAGSEPIDPPSKLEYFSALAASVAAVLSDPLAISLPFVLLLLIWWKRGTVKRSDVWPLAPFFAIVLVAMAANFLLWHDYSDLAIPAPSLSGLQRLSVAARAVGYFAINLLRLYPAEMIHPRWIAAWGAWNAAPVLMLLAFGLILWAGRPWWGPLPLLCTSLFVVILLPALVLKFGRVAPAIYVTDSEEYLASAIPLALAAAGLLSLAGWLSSPTTLRAARVTLGIIAVGLLAGFSIAQSASYRDAESGFKVALGHNPANTLARSQYAIFLLDEEPSKALQLLDETDDGGATSDLNLLDARGRVYLALGRPEDAVASYLRAARSSPENRSIRLALAGAYDSAGGAAMADGRRDEAFENYASALAVYDAARQQNPDDELIYDGMGKVMLHEGRLVSSLQELDAALQLNPGCVTAHVHKAQALFDTALLGDEDKMKPAFTEISEAIKDDPTNAEAYCALADMYYRLKNFAPAESGYRAAIQFNGGSAQTWTNLGFSQSAQNKYQEALRSFERALSLQADAPDALRGKSTVKAQLAMGNEKS